MCRTLCACGGIHLAGLGALEAEGLLAHDVLARGNAGQRNRPVGIVGVAITTALTLRIGGHVFVFGRVMGGSPFRLALLQQLLVGSDRDQFGTGDRCEFPARDESRKPALPQ